MHTSPLPAPAVVVPLGHGQHEVGVDVYATPPWLAIYPRRQPDADGHRVGPPVASPLVVLTFATVEAVETVLRALRGLRDSMGPPPDANGIVPVPDEGLVAALGGDLAAAREAFEAPYSVDEKLAERAEDGFGYRFHTPAAAWVGFLRGAAWQAQRAQEPEPGEDARDAGRYRWLTEDHADQALRDRRRELLERLPVMGKGAADAAIDALASPMGGKT